MYVCNNMAAKEKKSKEERRNVHEREAINTVEFLSQFR